MSEVAEIDVRHTGLEITPEVDRAARLAEALIQTVNAAIERGTKAVEALSALSYVAAELISAPPGRQWRDLRRSQRQYFDDSLGWYLADISRKRATAPPAE